MPQRESDTTADDLRYVDECERGGRIPAAFEGMSELRDSGLITLAARGWGHYWMALTAEGRRALKETQA